MLSQNDSQILCPDPPKHGQLRSVLADRLNARAVRRIADHVEHTAARFVDAIVADGGFDAGTLATDYPAEIVGAIGGLPAAMRARLPEWGEATSNVSGPFNDRAQAGFAVLQPMFAEFAALTTSDLDPDSLGGAIFAAAYRGEIDTSVRVDLLCNLTGPAIDTTISAMGTVLLELARHPDQWQLLRSDDSLALGAVNEAVRFDSPIQSFTRHARASRELGGTVVPRDCRVVVMYGSANRDERRFAEPDRFDVTRDTTDHLGFGFGVHSCLGSRLARLEIESFLKALAGRVTRLEPGEPVRRLCNIGRKLESLPVAVSG